MSACICGATLYKSTHSEAIAERGERGPCGTQAHASKGVPKPDRAFSQEHVEGAVNFIQGVANMYGLSQSAARRGRQGVAPTYLPASKSKKTVHSLYVSAVQESGGTDVIGYAQFTRLWSKYVPHIVVAKPRSDVCAICDKLRESIRRACTEQQTQEATQKLRDHLELACAERDFYNTWICQTH